MSLTIATEELLIGGKRTPAADGKTYETLNPATGEVLARVADAGVEDAERAIRAARASFDEGPWRVDREFQNRPNAIVSRDPPEPRGVLVDPMRRYHDAIWRLVA